MYMRLQQQPTLYTVCTVALLQSSGLLFSKPLHVSISRSRISLNYLQNFKSYTLTCILKLALSLNTVICWNVILWFRWRFPQWSARLRLLSVNAIAWGSAILHLAVWMYNLLYSFYHRCMEGNLHYNTTVGSAGRPLSILIWMLLKLVAGWFSVFPSEIITRLISVE